jgi:hypothetical protein
MTRAISRGDFGAALKWSLIFERQLSIALKLAELDPGDRRLRRFRPALASMRAAVLSADQRVDTISNIDNDTA